MRSDVRVYQRLIQHCTSTQAPYPIYLTLCSAIKQRKRPTCIVIPANTDVHTGYYQSLMNRVLQMFMLNEYLSNILQKRQLSAITVIHTDFTAQMSESHIHTYIISLKSIILYLKSVWYLGATFVNIANSWTTNSILIAEHSLISDKN